MFSHTAGWDKLNLIIEQYRLAKHILFMLLPLLDRTESWQDKEHSKQGLKLAVARSPNVKKFFIILDSFCYIE